MTHTYTPHNSSDSTPAPAGAGAVDCERRLRLVLRANAATSTLSGLAMAMAPGIIDDLLGTSQTVWVRVVGLALLPFAGFVAWLSTANGDSLRRFTPAIVAGDGGWVIASIVTVFLGWYSGVGMAAVLAMALAVGVFGLLQFNAGRHLERG